MIETRGPVSAGSGSSKNGDERLPVVRRCAFNSEREKTAKRLGRGGFGRIKGRGVAIGLRSRLRSNGGARSKAQSHYSGTCGKYYRAL